MSIAALFAWILTVFGGLVLLMIWIIEYDSEFQGSAATRLPVPVISTHALLGMGGLALWFSYILIDQDRLAWASVAVVGTAAVLGLAMAARWVRVYRSFARPGPGLASKHAVPPERNFPLPVVIAHGLLAVTTIVLVLVTTLGGSLCPAVTGRRLAPDALERVAEGTF
jgi:manganese efflux pump family protein